MELQLQQAVHEYFQSVFPAAFTAEITREAIVPDSCADIARIVQTTGCVCLTGREHTADGRFCASGTVEVDVIYIPEGDGGPSALHFPIPFQCFGEGQGGERWEFPHICAKLQRLDTRPLNPRKVLARANLAFYPTGCRHVSHRLCTGSDQGEQVQFLREEKHIDVLAAVREKEFSFTDEIPLAAGRGPLEEILSTGVQLRETDTRLIGNKLVIKGVAALKLLAREQGGRILCLQQELPFSQIMDGIGLEEDWHYRCAFTLVDLCCRTEGMDGGDMLTVDLTLRGRVTVHRGMDIAYLTDLYSTEVPVTCRMEELSLREDVHCQKLRISGRGMLETPVAVKSVVDTEIVCGEARFPGDGQVELPVEGRCLFLDESDQLHSVSGAFLLSGRADCGQGVQLSRGEGTGGEVIANILPDGVELRFPVDCAVEVSRPGRYLTIAGAETGEEPESGPRPSLVLRKLGEKEKLWSVAKQYRTTCKAILEVNEWPNESCITPGQLLLIPRTR